MTNTESSFEFTNSYLAPPITGYCRVLKHLFSDIELGPANSALKKFLVLHTSSTVLLLILKLSKWELGNKLFGRLKKWPIL